MADMAALSRSAARKAAAGDEPKVPVTPTVTASPGVTTSPQVTLTTAAQSSPVVPFAVQAVHIRLDSDAANRDEGLFPLRNYLLGNPGPCPVFIHISADGEKIIRAAAGISNTAKLTDCAGVVETWKE
jgi:hypothetical protein